MYSKCMSELVLYRLLASSILCHSTLVIEVTARRHLFIYYTKKRVEHVRLDYNIHMEN